MCEITLNESLKHEFDNLFVTPLQKCSHNARALTFISVK